MSEISWTGPIEFGCDLADRIKNLRGQGILLRLDTVGGNFFAGMKVAAEILGHGSVEVIAKRADSIGAVIFLAARRRLIHASGRLLLHRVRHESPVGGTCRDLRELADRIEERDREMALFIATRTGIALEQVWRWIDSDEVITATRAKELRMVHGIVGTPSALQERLAIAR